MQDIRQVREQAINDRVDSRLRAEMMIIVEDDDELLLNRFENFVEQDINGTFGLVRKFMRRLLQVREHHVAEIRADRHASA